MHNDFFGGVYKNRKNRLLEYFIDAIRQFPFSQIGMFCDRGIEMAFTIACYSMRRQHTTSCKQTNIKSMCSDHDSIELIWLIIKSINIVEVDWGNLPVELTLYYCVN